MKILRKDSIERRYLGLIAHFSNEFLVVGMIGRPVEAFNVHPNHAKFGFFISEFVDRRFDLRISTIQS